MRSRPSPLLPLFRSHVQGVLLALLYSRPQEEASITDLARRLEADVATVHREVERLERAGILMSRRVGRTRLVRTNPDSPFAGDLGRLVLRAFGPAYVMADLLAGVQGVRQAFIFGSWADRFSGNQGPAPADLDVLILGDPDRDQVFEIEERARTILGLQVSVMIRSSASWEADDTGFATEVRSGSIVPIDIEAA